jgi:hypothetical protein
MSRAMLTNGIEIVTLIICSTAWLLAAGMLTLDRLGRLPSRHARNIRAFRLQAVAILAMMTGAVITEISTMAGWPRSLRVGLDVVDILLGLALVTCVIIATSMRNAQAEPSVEAGSVTASPH